MAGIVPPPIIASPEVITEVYGSMERKETVIMLDESSPIVLDDLGDLRLEVGEHKKAFIVCSRAMARSSPVFRSMLYGGYAESKPTEGQWVVHLPEDNDMAFAVILNIIHLRMTQVPMLLPGTDRAPLSEDSDILLHHLAVLADKYLLLSLLQPWANAWLKPWRYVNKRLELEWSGVVASAAWTFGDERLLQCELDKVALTTRFRGKAHKGRAWIRDSHQKEWRLGAIPQGPMEFLDREGFSDIIIDTRDRLIQELIQPLHEFYIKPQLHMPGSPSEETAAFAVALFSAWFAVTERSEQYGNLNFYPWYTGNFEHYNGTVSELCRFLEEVERELMARIQRAPEGRRMLRSLQDTNPLKPMLRTFAEKLTKGPLVQITGQHKADLALRREITGVQPTDYVDSVVRDFGW